MGRSGFLDLLQCNQQGTYNIRNNMADSCTTPLDKVWKPELYKMQQEAPTPIPFEDSSGVNRKDAPSWYGPEYHGIMSHQEAEELLKNTIDGTYLLRRSPNAHDYYTLSVRFNNRTKHFKIYYKPSAGHYLQEQSKHYDTMFDLVADGLVNFYMQLHGALIIQQINQQTRHVYQQSPYMTLNRRKLRALSNELCKSFVTNEIDANDMPPMAEKRDAAKVLETIPSGSVENTSGSLNSGDTDSIIPTVYKRAHNFKVHNFKGFYWCELCANFLWGLTAQGVKCDACGFAAHNKCSELVPAKCMPDLKRIRGVFATDLTTMVLCYQCTIPFVVRRCVEEVEARGMLQEGIYRVSGFADEIDALKLALDRHGEKTDMSESQYGNVHVIAGTLKLYLRLLPVPLITFKAYPSFMQASNYRNLSEQLAHMKEATKELPPAHYNCLKYMMEHLRRVASHYAANKMNEMNIATVFAPTLIATPQHLTNLTEEIFMLSLLITHCEKIFD